MKRFYEVVEYHPHQWRSAGGDSFAPGLYIYRCVHINRDGSACTGAFVGPAAPFANASMAVYVNKAEVPSE